MSEEITTARVKQFSATVFHLSQQRGTRLRRAVRQESQVGKSAFYDRIGQVTAIVKTGRHADTPQIDTPHSRRRVTLTDYIWADLIDEADKLRLLMEPEGQYAMAAMWAMGRAMDQKIIDEALGNAFGGEEGGTTVAHPNTQKIASVSSGAGSNLNVEALRRAKTKLDEADVDPSIPRFWAYEASQLESLLGETEVTSSDFASVKALVQGEVDSFMGFNFIRLQLLNAQSGALSFNQTTGAVGSGSGDADGYRRQIAWAQDGLLLALAQDMTVEIEKRADKQFSTQVFAKMGIGSTRMEEEKVVEILSNEA